MPIVYTIGFQSKPLAEFIGLLRGADVDAVIGREERLEERIHEGIGFVARRFEPRARLRLTDAGQVLLEVEPDALVRAAFDESVAKPAVGEQPRHVGERQAVFHRQRGKVRIRNQVRPSAQFRK